MFFSLNTKSSIKFGIIIVSIIFLGYAAFTSQKYGFYTSLKIFFFISSIYLAILSYETTQNFWLIRFLIVTFIYNPFIKFPFGKSIWELINIFTMVFFIIALLRFKIGDNGTDNPFAVDNQSNNNDNIEKKNNDSVIINEIENLKKEIEILKNKDHTKLSNQKIGFIDKSKLSKFDYIGSFSDGLAIIKLNKLYGYIDKKGDVVIEPTFLRATDFSEGLAVVQENIKSKLGYINKQGNFIIKPRFEEATLFNDGLANLPRHELF